MGKLVRVLARAMERLVFGGRMRFAFLRWCLDHYFRSVRRREWRWSEHPPFYDHRLNAWDLLVGVGNPHGLIRAFYSGEAVRDGDRVLDIGCGDGFFASRFLAPKANHVVSVDIDARAIDHARRHNIAENVSFVLLDAVRDPFPQQKYDVIVWDGAIGHFSRSDAESLLAKVARHLEVSGRFCGSEALGHDGADHLQVFRDETDLVELLRAHFPVVRTKVATFAPTEGTERTEVFWRCSADRAALNDLHWSDWPAR